MKVLLLSLVSLTNVVVQVHGDTLTCKVIPFDTKDGISGTCCVIFKNSSKAFPQEEIKQQILKNKNKEVPSTARPPQGERAHQDERAKSDDEKLVFKNERNKTMQGRTNVGQTKETEKNVGQTKETEKNVTIKNKNAFDVPSGCPEGQGKTHSSTCEDSF